MRDVADYLDLSLFFIDDYFYIPTGKELVTLINYVPYHMSVALLLPLLPVPSIPAV